MRATRRDINHSQVGEIFAKCGWTMIDSASFFQCGQAGFPDWMATRGVVTIYIEVKNGFSTKLTKHEVQWRADHPRLIYLVVRTDEGAKAAAERLARWADKVQAPTL